MICRGLNVLDLRQIKQIREKYLTPKVNRVESMQWKQGLSVSAKLASIFVSYRTKYTYQQPDSAG